MPRVETDKWMDITDCITLPYSMFHTFTNTTVLQPSSMLTCVIQHPSHQWNIWGICTEQWFIVQMLTASSNCNNFTAVVFAQFTTSHTHPFNGPFSGTTRVSRYQKGKTNLDFTEARDSEWQWHQLGHMQVCSSLQTDNHNNTPPLSFLQAGCPSCSPTNSVKAPKG